MSSSTNYDHYSVANELAKKLEAEGHNQWASKIRTTMAEGSTGTEIFMGLKWQLENLKGAEIMLPQEAEKQLEELLQEIGKSLA